MLKFKKLSIEAYKPGKSNLKRFKKIVKLSANESALGVSSEVKKIISNKNINFFKYPDGKSKKLKSRKMGMRRNAAEFLENQSLKKPKRRSRRGRRRNYRRSRKSIN